MLWIRKNFGPDPDPAKNFQFFYFFGVLLFDPDSDPYPDENLISSTKKQCYGSVKFWSGSGSCKKFLFFYFFGVLLFILIRMLMQMRTLFPRLESNVMDP
jgi:hypothetical protein